MIYPIPVNHLFHVTIREEALHLAFKDLSLKKLYTTGKSPQTYPKIVVDRFWLVTSCLRGVPENDYEKSFRSLAVLQYELVTAPNNHKACLTNNWHLAFSTETDQTGSFILIKELMQSA